MNLQCLKILSFLIIGLSSFQLSAQTSCIFEKDLEIKALQIGNLLEWSTLEEQNNEYFVIQRSLDGLEFETLTNLNSQGNSKKPQSYQFLDTQLGMDKIIYRLVQIDKEGQTFQGKMILTQRNTPNNFQVTQMSNTSTDRIFTLTVESQKIGICRYQVLDAEKLIRLQNDVHFDEGSNLVSINLEHLDDGDYTFLLKMGHEVEALVIRKVPFNAMLPSQLVVKEEK